MVNMLNVVLRCEMIIHKRKGYGHQTVVYYCSQDVVELYGGVDKVPLFACGIYYVSNLDDKGCGIK